MEEKINPKEEYQARLERLKKIREQGIDPYPSKVKQTQQITEVLQAFDQLLTKGDSLAIAGRIRAIRLHGGSCFAVLENNGQRLQIYLKADELTDQQYHFFTDQLDVGDFLEAQGNLFLTKRGEKTLLVKDFRLLAKALLPLPEKWHGLKDIESRYRQRYLDFLANPEVKEIFFKRNQIIQFIRTSLTKEGFFEIDTPILQTVASGAIALPFKTHHNALKTDLFLRVAPEIYLKELVIGGFDQVFEIARCFRNEGIDYAHNPEFTQLEFYWAYKDYQFLMGYMEKFLQQLVLAVCGKTEIEYDSKKISFQGPFPRLDFRQALIEAIDLDLDQHDADSLRKAAKAKGLPVDKSWGKGKLADELYKEFVRPELINPTYLVNHPVELSPLAKKIADRPNYVERFQLIVGGRIELINAFSELNDPLDQEERFNFQQKLAKQGDRESMNKDQEFVEALKYGLPPTAGLGLGIDRLVNLLTDTNNIKEVIAFPTLRPKN